MFFVFVTNKSVPIETRPRDSTSADGCKCQLVAMDIPPNETSVPVDDNVFIDLNAQSDKFLDSLLKIEDDPSPFLPEFSPSCSNDVTMSTDTASTSYSNAENGSCLDSELSSVDHMPFNAILESSICETIDADYEKKIHDDNKKKNYDKSDHTNNHYSLEAKSTIIQQPKLFENTPRLVVISPPIQSKGPIDVFNYKQSPKQVQSPKQALSPESMYKLLDLSNDEIESIKIEEIKLPSQFPLTEQEASYVNTIRRKIRNRKSAQLSRKRRKQYFNDLEAKAKRYSDEKIELQAENKRLKAELERLEKGIGPWLNGKY